jgi:type I restriction enzyme M protein
MDRSSLKSHLWEAANTFRGSAVGRSNWKGYILPLLFFKRFGDGWDKETVDAAEIYGDVVPSLFPEIHRFQLPDGCHWNDIRATAPNVGTALKHAMQKIERANPDTHYRVFGAADWGNKEKFNDERRDNLIEGFLSISLGKNAVDTYILGDAYEYLVGKFADVPRRNRADEFYTLHSVVRMMAKNLDHKEGESISGPACGIGGMLLAAVDHVKRDGGDPRTFFGK